MARSAGRLPDAKEKEPGDTGSEKN